MSVDELEWRNVGGALNTTIWIEARGWVRPFWRVTWRRWVTPGFQPRICYWDFSDEVEARRWYKTFGTDDEPGIRREGKRNHLEEK